MIGVFDPVACEVEIELIQCLASFAMHKEEEEGERRNLL